jgi:beta-galactosidase
MRKLLPIASLLLYAGITLAAAPVAPGDTTLLPITILVTNPATHLSPAANRLHTPPSPPTPSAHLMLRLSNPSPTVAITHIALEWELQVNGTSRQKGTTANLTITPRQTILVRLPARWPGNDSNEVFLRLRYRQVTPATQPSGSHPGPGKTLATTPGPVLAEQQLLVQAPAGNIPEVRPDGELSFTDVNDTFNIQSPLIHIEFNKQTGWLQRYEVNGSVLLTDTPLLTANFWRPGAPGDTATIWQDASHGPHLQLFSTSTGNTMIIVRTEYTLPPTPCLLHVSYTINAKGEILVAQQLEADSTQKGWPLPCFGMRWLLPAGYDSIEYYGPGKTNDFIGIYHDTVGRQPASPDSNQRNHATATDIITAIRWIRISGPGGSGLLITADSTLFNASALLTIPPILLQIDSRQPSPTGIPGDNHQLSYGLPYGSYRCTYKVSPFSAHQIAFTDHH